MLQRPYYLVRISAQSISGIIKVLSVFLTSFLVNNLNAQLLLIFSVLVEKKYVSLVFVYEMRLLNNDV